MAEYEADAGLVPILASRSSGKSVAVIGSGPAGLAAAQQLTRAGHRVVVFERAEQPGGLLRYGVPEFKMEKAVIDRRITQMLAEGTEFRTRTAVGDGALREVEGAAAPFATVVSSDELRQQFDAIVLATGSTRPRDLEVPGRGQPGVHFAMEYLKQANLALEGALLTPQITATGKHVIIIGGGDTGADCLGTVHRQGAASVHQLEILPEPPADRVPTNPWPTWPVILRSSAAHEEGGDRLYSIGTSEFVRNASGDLQAIRVAPVARDPATGGFLPVAGEERVLEAELGAACPRVCRARARTGVLGELGLEVNASRQHRGQLVV